MRIVGRAISRYPLHRLEAPYDGRVVATAAPDQDGLTVALDQTIPDDRGGWMALRVAGPPHADQPTGVVFAQASPVYLDVPGRPLRSREDAAYFLAWIDRLADDVHRRDRIPNRHRTHVEAPPSAARAVARSLAEEGN